MRRTAAVVLAVVLIVTGAATQAVSGAASCPGGSPAEKGAVAVAALRYPWQGLGYSVDFRPARAGYLGMTYPDQRRIEVFVRPCQSVGSVAKVFAHEVGHVVDLAYNDAARRQEWQAIRGFATEWFPCAECSDYASGAGDFAEAFAFLKAPRDRYRSQLAGPPSAAQAAQLERFFQPPPPPAPPPPNPSPDTRGLLERLLPSLRLLAQAAG